MYFAGFMSGNAVIGTLTDQFGRRIPFIALLIIVPLVGILQVTFCDLPRSALALPSPHAQHEYNCRA